MGKENAITLRFRNDCLPDMELYRRLKEDKERMGVSMPDCTKEAIRRGFEAKDRSMVDAEFLNEVKKSLHREMESFCTVIIGMISQMQGRQTMTSFQMPEEGRTQECALPKISDEAPDSLIGMLDKFK